MEDCVIVLRVMRHNTTSRTVIQITKNTCVYVFTHTHVALTRSQLIVSSQILWAGQAEEGEVTWPLMTTYEARSQIAAFQLSFFQRWRKIPTACFTPNGIFTTGGHRQARGTHINVRKPHEGNISCHGFFKLTSKVNGAKGNYPTRYKQINEQDGVYL